MDRFGILAGRPPRCRLLVALMLLLATAGCAGQSAPGRDTTAPGPVTDLRVSATSLGADWLSLSWTNPTGADFTGAMLRRLKGATAPTLTSGTLVTDFNDGADYVVNPGLTPGTQYSYAMFAHDGANNYSAAAVATGRTQVLPQRTK